MTSDWLEPLTVVRGSFSLAGLTEVEGPPLVAAISSNILLVVWF